MSAPFVSRGSTRRPTVGAWTVVALATAALMMLGVTWAAWSDFVVVNDNRVGAGTLVIEGDEGLQMWLPARGTTDEASLTVSNVGTTDADLSLTLLAAAATGTLCEGYDAEDHAGDLRLLVDGADVGPLCGSFDTPVPIGTTAAGSSVDVVVAVTLAEDALFRWSGRSGTFPLEVHGNQPGGGFSDFARGSVSVGIGDDVPPVELPADCLRQLGDYRAYYELANGNEDLDLAALGVAGPVVVVALNGNHDVVGTPQGDCIIVGNGTMTVHGGDGDDMIVSAHPNGRAHGGGKAQQLRGEGGDDTILARRGNVGIDGGPGTDTCEAATNSNVTIDECETAVVLTTQDAEVSTNELEVAPLAPESLPVSSEPTKEAAPTAESTPAAETTPAEPAPTGDASSTEPAPPPDDERVTSDSVEDIVPDDDGQTEPAIVPTEVTSDESPSEPAREADSPSPTEAGAESGG